MTYTPQLKNWEYYENLYDRRVVTQCRMTEEACEKGIQKELADNKFWKSEEFIRFQHTKCRDIYLYHQKGDLALKREETIQKWMKEHRERDDFYYNAKVKAPYCIHCNREMIEIMKQDYFSYSNTEKNRILFMFECKECDYRRWRWDNGEDYVIKPSVCDKCWSEDIKHELIQEEKWNTFREACNKCGYVKDDFYEHHPVKKERDLNYEKDRQRFVLSSEKIYEFRRWIENMDKIHEMVEADKRKQKAKEEWQEEVVTPQIKKLDFPDLKELIIRVLKKKKYNDITFSNPIVSKKWASVELTVAGKGLEKKEFLEIIQWPLENTNWKVNEKSILNNLGILQCRLDGS